MRAVVSSPSARARSETKSQTESGRSSGSRAMAAVSTAAASGGAWGHASRRFGGASVEMACATSMGVRPLRAFAPVSIS